MTLGFVVLSFALAFWQRPGWATTDTKLDLHVDPVHFLSFVASVWTQTTDLGEVHSAQYTGYLWPMGPFYALMHIIGLSAWVAQRVWLGCMFALAVWGMLKLMDVMFDRRRGIAHAVAATFFLFNPYTVVFTGRTSITLLGYAALPWFLIVVHHGVRGVRRWRDWQGWWWAALFAIILTSIGGGINAAVVGWMLVGPLVLLIYEPLTGAVRWRDSLTFLLRMGVLGILASLWWILPLLVHVQYGIDFLKFTEQPASIWGTNSITEALRLMSYWTSYIQFGFHGVQRPLYSNGATMLFSPLVIGASLVLPAIAIASFLYARRWRYGPFLLLMTVVGVVIMTGGFPIGTPLRDAMEAAYRATFIVRFMRTTQKAAPLVACGVAALLGIGAQVAWLHVRSWNRERGPRWRSARPVLLAGGPIVLLALIVLASLPLVRGIALDRQVIWKRIPAAWTNAGHDLNRQLPANTRALILPGQIFAYYKWGGTIDAILPRVTTRPVAVRYETPYSDLHADDLLATVDDLVQQRRLFPGQLSPLLRLMGVGAVVTGSDDDITRSGAIDPAAAAGDLAANGFAHPSRSYGPVTAFPPAAGDIGPTQSLPQVRRYDVPAGRGIVHVDSGGSATIVDGSGAGLADMAALGELPAHSPIFYAGDLNTAALQRQTAAGADVVVTDSNRRQQFVPEYPQQNLGDVLSATDPVPFNFAITDPFPALGSNGQTVSVLQGARYLQAISEGGTLSFPENAPIAAFDGNLSTSWVADRYVGPVNRYVDVGFTKPRDVPYVDVYPLSGRHGVVTRVDVNGIGRNVGLGLTRIPVNLHNVAALRIRIDNVRQPKVGLGGPGGFREIRIPGFHVRELLRTPVLVAKALAGRELSHSALTYVFERQTGEDPFLRNRYRVSPVLDKLEGSGDAEQYINRATFTPAARSYRVAAWVNPSIYTADSALDRLAGVRGSTRFDSSSRFQDQPRYRASSAFDGSAATAWISDWLPGEAPHPWISWTTPHAQTVSYVRIAPPSEVVARPTQVQLSSSAGTTAPLAVAADGTVSLPRPMRARSFRMTVLAASYPAGATPRQRLATAVGIGELSVPGLRPVAVPRSGSLTAPCGTVRVEMGGRVAALRPVGTIAALDAGQPLRASSCGAPTPMGSGIEEIRSLPGPFSVDLLSLRSPAPNPVAAAAGGGTVLKPGLLGTSSVDGVRVALNGPSWLSLGESYDQGWGATCDGRSLGASQPIDGYGNGWLAPANCHRVAFTFGPQSIAREGYLLSGIICFVLLIFLIVGRLRGSESLAVRTPLRALPEPPAARLAIGWALIGAAPFAAVLGLVFSLRAGAGLYPVLVVILWRGYGPRVLVPVAALLLGVVVPIVYLGFPPPNLGGFNFNYSVSLIWAHWIGVGAIVILAVSCWRMLASQRRALRVPPPDPSDEAADPERTTGAPEGQLTGVSG